MPSCEQKTNWINVNEMLPNAWAQKTPYLSLHCVKDLRFKVKLADGRLLFTWWEGSGWSIERLKPHLKVTHWVAPIIKA